MTIGFEIKFEGAEADEHILDFYDASQALVGFQRSLALTTHFVLNNEIITQAPALKNARILALPPEEGSWRTKAVVIIGAAWALGNAPRDTPVGHMISSVYDYVVSETLGFHVDYDESLGQSLERYREEHGQTRPRESQVDSLIEKCEAPIREMHRPLAFSETAHTGRVLADINGDREPLGPVLDLDTWNYISTSTRSTDRDVYEGWVSSYNINTFKGRAYLSNYGRPVPFILAEEARDARTVALITTSLNDNARVRLGDEGRRHFEAFVVTSSTGRVKSVIVTSVRVRAPD